MAELLRRDGHIVYDFTDPSCRKTPEIPPEKYPEQFDPEQHNYRDYLLGNPEWRGAVLCNQQALDMCDCVVLLLPCGNDAHADWAYGVGKGKRSIVVGHPVAGDRTPTHMWADALLDVDEQVPSAIRWFIAEQRG
jgi:hypothetical protein